MQMETVLWENTAFRVTPRGLDVHGETNQSDWLALASRLGSMAGASWALGDCLVEMGKRYGSTYDAAAVSGLDLATLRNLKWLASSFERSRRRDDLSLSHYEAVLAVDPALQDDFLSRAASNKWTRQELRVHIRDRDRKDQNWPQGTFGLICADPPWKYAAGPGG
jgi:hypothetical protein